MLGPANNKSASKSNMTARANRRRNFKRRLKVTALFGLKLFQVEQAKTGAIHRVPREKQQQQQQSKSSQAPTASTATATTAGVLCILVAMSQTGHWAAGQALHVSQLDPRPTIYSGQVSFGLLLSAHSSLGTEMSTSASQQVLAIAHSRAFNGSSPTILGFQQRQQRSEQLDGPRLASVSPAQIPNRADTAPLTTTTTTTPTEGPDQDQDDDNDSSEPSVVASRGTRTRRQIFEHLPARRIQHLYGDNNNNNRLAPGSLSIGQQSLSQAGSSDASSGQCSQVNPNALYAGMGAIWASHQANLISDSQFTIGAYVYDSCNDLDVGQRQSVRIVSNLNAFQQTTCESPRGSPISLIIAHGENQLRAIQLLTSFRVPVISTKEHFALEDFSLLTRDQRNFLFSTAPSSRHLAKGAIRFSGRVAAKLKLSPKLPNYHHQNSPKNGLIVISRNLPARFVSHLSEEIPRFLKYELIQSSSPIDQIRSVEALESIMLRQVDKSSDEFASSGSSTQDSSAAAAASEISTKLAELIEQQQQFRSEQVPATTGKSQRLRRSDGSSSDDSDSSDAPSAPENSRMLSPMIMLFITPSEAIDLVTRLRNDLAEVSKYYSLIVVTREDITPALKTIFHRGGSRLCAGKAFYVIGPKPDDISEFGRYFRDTVQIEAETSDHPLVSEFAKFQAGSRITADLDDVGAEPVIKAVWTAAAAFKAVHKRECGSINSGGGGSSSPAGATGGPASSVFRGSSPQDDKAPGYTSGGRMKSRQQANSGAGGGGGSTSSPTSSSGGTKSAHSECMIKMSKTMSHMVQLKLKRLDHTINSTGLQSLDGFRIKFDEQNELMSNKFSIRHINKECEIEEVGHFSGFDDSKLLLDKEAYERALDSTMPDAWPLPPPPPPPPTPTPAVLTSSGSLSSKASKEQQVASSPSASSSGGQAHSGGGSNSAADETGSGSDSSSELAKRKYPKRAESVQLDTNGLSKPDNEEDDSTSGNDNNAFEAPPKRPPAKRSRTSTGEMSGLASSRKELESPTTGATAGKAKQRWPATTMRSQTGQRGFSDSMVEPTTEPAPPTIKPMRILKPFPTSAGTLLKDWLPASSQDSESLTQRPPSLQVSTPAYTTLPESDGNADLEPPTRTKSVKQIDVGAKRLPSPSGSKSLETAATTESSSYISLPAGSSTGRPPSLSLQQAQLQFGRHAFGFESRQPALVRDVANHSLQTRQLDFLRDLNLIPTPLGAGQIKSHHGDGSSSSAQVDQPEEQQSESRSNRSQLRSHLRWIYNSWSALGILVANIFGALLTLYVLTFLLMKNCDGSLDRENQGLRSIHLLGIIIVFFGSTLFIVSPTPGLCLLRTSWHNFSLVLLFGSLLLQTMQTRSLSSLGLGGRPNKLNQFLTLVFMVGVQVALELQRWKYESANYLHFINQNFGTPESDYKKLMILGNAIVNQFNAPSPFSDLVTPVSIQVSEKYQNLLHDYCLQKADDFLQSQAYLCIIICLLVIFSITTRNMNVTLGSYQSSHPQSASFLTSGKMVASEHEANLNLSATHNFKPSFPANNSNSTNLDGGAKMFPVTMMGSCIYVASVLLQYYGQNSSNADLIASVTMVLIAFITLVGIFLPILSEIHKYDTTTGTLSRPMVSSQSIMPDLNGNHLADSITTHKTFTMFPEFAPVGVRRPSSIGGDSSSGGGSRSPFAGTKESRRNMGFTLANMAPSLEELRAMQPYGQERANNSNLVDNRHELNLHHHQHRDQQEANHGPQTDTKRHSRNHQGGSQESLQIVDDFNSKPRHKNQTKLLSKGEKRLIRLDVDPCCPRHGHTVHSKPKDRCTSEGMRS